MTRGKKIRAFLALFLMLNGMAPLLFVACHNGGPDIIEITGQKIIVEKQGNYKELIIRINYSYNVISQVNTPGDGFMNAFATSPALPGFANKISRIEISLIDQFDDTHPSGSDLQELFSITDYPGLSATTNVFPVTPDESHDLYLLLKVPPSTDLQTKISITSYLDDGQILISKGIPLTIKM